MPEVTKQVVADNFAAVHTFQSAAAVGLIVEHTFKGRRIGRRPDSNFEGSFLSPEDARKVADHLNACADAAEAERNRYANLTDEERRAVIDRAMGRAEA